MSDILKLVGCVLSGNVKQYFCASGVLVEVFCYVVDEGTAFFYGEGYPAVFFGVVGGDVGAFEFLWEDASY